MPAAASRGLLGLGDDHEFRRAVQQFWLSDPRAPLQQFADVTRRAAAERRLAELSESSESSEHRSLLTTMRGGLLLENGTHALRTTA